MAAQQIGVVSATKGEVFARNAQGQTRRLSVGDPVMEGDIVVTANGSTVDITPLEGPVIHVAEQQTMAMEGGVAPSAPPHAADGATTPQVAETAAKVIQGENPDFNAQLEDEAAAAGLAGGGAEGGHSFVNLLRIAEGTQGVGYDFGINPLGEPAQITGNELAAPPSAGDVTISVDEDDLSYSEDISLAWVGAFEDSLGVDAVISSYPGNNDEMDGDDLPPGSPTTLSGNLNFTSPGGVVSLVFNLPTEAMTSGGEPVQFWLSPDGHTLVGYVTTESYSKGEESVPMVQVIFEAEITDVAKGTFSFTLFGPLDHPLVGTEDNLTVPLSFTITNPWGSADGTLTVNIDDDSPVPIYGEDGEEPTPLSDTVTVEDEKMQGWLGRMATDEHDYLSSQATGTIVNNVQWGADGFGGVTGFDVGEQHFDVGTTVYWDQYGNFLGTDTQPEGEESQGEEYVRVQSFLEEGGSHHAAMLVVNEDGTYTFTLLDNMLMGQGEQGEQIDLLDTVTINAQDGDGDPMNVDVNLQVQDDKPACLTVPDIVIVEDEQLNPPTDEFRNVPWDLTAVATGTIVNNVAWGADGFGGATGFDVEDQHFEAGTTVYWDQNGNFLGTNQQPVFETMRYGGGGEDHGHPPPPPSPAASLVVNADGTYTFQLLDNMLLGKGIQGEQTDLLDTVRITAQDGDGDLVGVNVFLKVEDDKPSFMMPETAAIVEDENMYGGIDENENPDLGYKVTGDVSDNGNWGADGFDKITQIQIGEDTVSISGGEDGTTVYWDQNGNFLGTHVGGEDHVAASLKVESDGDYTFRLLDNMLMGKGVQGEQTDFLDRVIFTGQDKDGDQATISLDLKVVDDKPGVMAAQTAAIVEDENMYGGIDENEHPDLGYMVTGDVSNNGSWGADGFDKITQIQIGEDTVSISGGEDGTTVYWDQNGNFLGTHVGGEDHVAASLKVESDGDYTFKLLDNMLKGQGVQGEQTDLLANVVFTGQDKDGDKATISLDLKVVDDQPTINVCANDNISSGDRLTVDETNLNANDWGNFAGYFSVSAHAGADGQQGNVSSTYSLTVKSVGVDSGLDDTATGANVLLYIEDGKVVGRAGGSTGEIVFTVSVDGSGKVTLDQQRAVEHDNPNDSNDPATLAASNLVGLTCTSSITDKDGDTASDSATLYIGTALRFLDDGPSVSPNSAVVLDDTDLPESTMSGTLAHAFGADGAGQIDFAAMNGKTGMIGTEQVTYTWDGNTNTLTATGPRGALFEVEVTDPATGAYTVTQLDNVLHAPPVQPITIDVSNYQALSSVVKISVDAPGHNDGATLKINDGAFGIASNTDGGNDGRFDEINYIQGEDSRGRPTGDSEEMTFELLQNKVATSAIVNLSEFYGNEGGVGNEVGAYALYLNGQLVQNWTNFTADSTSGNYQFEISRAGGFDEIRFEAKLGTSDGQGGDSSDYNVKSITFNFAPVEDPTAALKYTVTDKDGDHVDGTLNLVFHDDVPVAVGDTQHAAEGYWAASGEDTVTVDTTRTIPAGWGEDYIEHEVDDTLTADPDEPYNAGSNKHPDWRYPSADQDTSNSFHITASNQSGHWAKIEFDIHVQGYQSGDGVKVELLKDGSVVQTTGFITASVNNAYFWVNDTANYSLRLYADDNSKNGNLVTSVDNISYYSKYTPEQVVPGTATVTVPDMAWVPAAEIGPLNIMVNDNQSNDGTVVAMVGGAPIAESGITDIAGTYGTLHISANGDYTYMPNQTDNPAGAQDEFQYVLKDGDGDMSNPATLTIVVDDYPYTQTATGGADFLGGTSGVDALDGLGGNDAIYGGAGADTLTGGAGNDALMGGTGADTFVWHLTDAGTNATPSADVVKDFSSGDTLQLNDLLSSATQLSVTVADGNTTIHIADNAINQTIVLQGYDDTAAATIEQQLLNTVDHKFTAG